MRTALAPVLLCVATALTAEPGDCGRPVCAEPPGSLRLAHEITFDDLRGGMGPGRQIEGILDQPGARFGERFAGQSLGTLTAFGVPYDTVLGPATGLILLPGVPGQNLSILRLPSTNVLSGDGPAGVPRQRATGEGAIAVAFAEPQGAVRLILRGGEGGSVTVLFLAPGGQVIDRHVISPAGEGALDFARVGGTEDIGGLVITNRDPEGIALDAVAFGLGRQISALVP